MWSAQSSATSSWMQRGNSKNSPKDPKSSPQYSRKQVDKDSPVEEAETLFEADRDEEMVSEWKYLTNCEKKASSGQMTTTSGENAWWLVLSKWLNAYDAPSFDARSLGSLSRGSPVFCITLTNNWLQFQLKEPSAPTGDSAGARRPIYKELQESSEAWLPWDPQEGGSSPSVPRARPLWHLMKMCQYRSTDVPLPKEAVTWTISEIDMYLGSTGFIAPGRESALMRSSKRLVRAVRGGAMGLEYRVDGSGRVGGGGVFAMDVVAKGAHVEVCPLLEIDSKLRAKSRVLKRITVPMQADNQRFAIVLGLGKVYSKSKTPNLHWSYRGDDEVVLWAAEEVHAGCELTIDFSAPSLPLDRARSAPKEWQPPGQKNHGKLKDTGYVVHGNSSVHGRGVFVTKDLAAGTLVESCPACALDESGAEAMLHYRWGVEGDANSAYYILLGLGSLYNHSEQPNARGRLDVKRSVVEFYTEADLRVGQEVLVSYGDTYFDEDFEGHRKSELLHIEAPQTGGDAELQRVVEMQRALIHNFTSEEFKRELQCCVRMPTSAKDRYRSVHALIIKTELPILERYGYDKSWQGCKKMTMDLEETVKRLNTIESEAVHNIVLLGSFISRFEPLPVEYWDMMKVELVILGTDTVGEPETVHLEIPCIVPCGFVKCLIKSHLGSTSARIDLVKEINGMLSTYQDYDPMPKGKVLVAGIGDIWQDKEKLEYPEFGPWDPVWQWLRSPDTVKQCSDFHCKNYTIAGTWNNFQPEDMYFDGDAWVFFMEMGHNKWESFQILQEGCWSMTLYPSIKDGSPSRPHVVKGPDGKGHGKNWTVGFSLEHQRTACGKPGSFYKIQLLADPLGKPDKVLWSDLGKNRTAVDREVKALLKQATTKQEEKTLEASKRLETSKALRQEYLERSARRQQQLEQLQSKEFM